MANGVIPATDITGFGRLAQAIRQNRQEARQGRLDEQAAKTRGLQNQLLQGQATQQRGQLANLAQQGQQKTALMQTIQNNPDKDPDFVTFEFLTKNNPEAARGFHSQLLKQAGDLSKINPKGAVDFLNAKTGTDFEYQGDEAGFLKIGSPSAGKVVLYDPATDTVKREFAFDSGSDDTKFQLKEGTDAQGQPTFFKFDPTTGIVPEGIFPKIQRGETIESLPDGGFKITRGGGGIQEKKFAAKEKENKIKAERRAQQSKAKTDIVLTKVDEAIKNIGLKTAGFGGTAFGLIPGTAARDLQGSIDTIKANLAFQALQDMREASPTGGALGAVSERELNLLESTITSLDTSQSPERVRENLEQIKDLFTRAKERLDIADSFRRKNLDPDNLTPEQLNTQEQTGVKIVIPNHPQYGDVTEDDIIRTMSETGLTRDQVFKALGAQ